MLDLILKRRSVRQYLKKEVEETVLKAILSAGLLAPTGMNKKPCRFYVIKKKEILEALSTVKPAGAAMLKEAPVAIAVIVDEKEPIHGWRTQVLPLVLCSLKPQIKT